MRRKKPGASRTPPKRKQTTPGKRIAKGIREISPSDLQAGLAKRRQALKDRQAQLKAQAARNSYKPRKKDRGKIVLIGTKGQKDPQLKGRKAYAVYVTKTGKKWLLKVPGAKEPYKPRKLSEIELPVRKNLRKAQSVFQASRRVYVSQHKAAVKGKGRIDISSRWDFNEKVIERLAKSIKKAMDAQASKRTFIISVAVYVRLMDGTTQTFFFEVPIDRPDHIAIKLAGLKNFIRQKFYAFMARELAFAGYVTSGSYNHIRGLNKNAFASREDWLDDRDQNWTGADKEIVRIEAIEWTIEQVV